MVSLLLLATPVAAQVLLPATEPLPVVDGSPETRSTPFGAWPFDLADAGYTESEYLLSGTANLYDYLDDAGQSPDVLVTSADVPYTTRFLVRRPANPAAFSGTVFIEILNPSLGHDVDYQWQYTHRALMDEGAVWVGITGTATTARFLRDLWGRQSADFVRNNSRYQTLQFSADGLLWDMLSQLGALIKTPDDAENPLGDLAVEQVILMSFSRTAENVVTYAVSFHADALMPDGTTVYDGFFVNGGTASAKVVNPTRAVQRLAFFDPRNLFPGDVPAMRFQSQTEMLPGFAVETARQTEDDYALVRTYEVAGAAHIDLESEALGQPFLERDLGRSTYFPAGFCPPFGGGPIRQSGPGSALLLALDNWVRYGDEPPASRLISLVEDAEGELSIELDADGNALGGLRPPALDVPSATYITRPVPYAPCFLLGDNIPFSVEELTERYGTERNFLVRMRVAVNAAIDEGYLLPYDGDVVMADAAVIAAALPGEPEGSGGGGAVQWWLALLLLGAGAVRVFRR